MGVQINGDTGNISATKADYSGNVTIGGTLTYEDVTNIDSVGLVTARSGIEVGARPGVAASISVDGNMIVSGISTFGGTANFAAVSGTTGTFSGDVKSTAGILDIRSGSSINTNVTGASASGTLHKNTTSGEFAVVSGGTGGNNHLTFYTSASAAPTEKARITSDGKMGLGISSPTGQFAVSDGTRIAEINPHSSGTFIGNRSNHDVLFQVNAATKAKIDTNGHLTISDGDLVIGTGGHGIDFSAQTSTTASDTTTNSELLDHYEEGTWTPLYEPSGGISGASYTSQVGDYIRIGRFVFVQFYISYSASSASGFARISGLPFNPQNYGTGSMMMDNHSGNSSRWYVAHVSGNSNDLIYFYGSVAGSGWDGLTADDSASIIGSVCYLAP